MSEGPSTGPSTRPSTRPSTGSPAGPIHIGGASGFWGDAALATQQLLAGGSLDFLVYDYLAEVTMSIMARARLGDPDKGYATDFVSAAMAPNLEAIATADVKVLANAGGVNPRACAEALRAIIRERGLSLTVAVVLGDDLSGRAAEFAGVSEMFSGAPFPPVERIASINAYLGAFPLARALDEGADIVITGRCVDSAVTLAACIHAFGWREEDYDQLAQGSLAGHILECGTQATGGNFTDWESVAESLSEAGYPIAEVSASGDFVLSKAPGTGGQVSVGTVGEQMLYEIGDPQCYTLPDVVCDFSGVTLEQTAADVVAVSGARGRGSPRDYKVCATWADGYRAGQLWTMIGRAAPRKAEVFAAAVFDRSNKLLAAAGQPPLSETSLEILGVESHYGAAATREEPREVDFKLAAKHPTARGVGIFLKEMVGLALTAPPGLAGFAGARPKPTPVVRLYSFLLPRDAVQVSVELEGQEPIDVSAVQSAEPTMVEPHRPPAVPDAADLVNVSLEQLAFGRSGDKGDKANIGLLARDAAFVPWIGAAVTSERVAAFFAHFLADPGAESVERFYLQGTGAFNFLLHGVLGGGGVASLRADPQGKSYAQLLLSLEIPIPADLALAHELSGGDVNGDKS